MPYLRYLVQWRQVLARASVRALARALALASVQESKQALEQELVPELEERLQHGVPSKQKQPSQLGGTMSRTNDWHVRTFTVSWQLTLQVKVNANTSET